MRCRSRKASCYCFQRSGHLGNHRCLCDGSWDRKGNVIAFPNPGKIISAEVMVSIHKRGKS